MEQYFIDIKNIVASVTDTVFNHKIEPAAAGKGKARFAQEILRFPEVQFQGDSEGADGGFSGIFRNSSMTYTLSAITTQILKIPAGACGTVTNRLR